MIRYVAALFLFLVSFQIAAAAQDPPRLVSPEVQADRTVVFRLWAPNAKQVQVSGDWGTAALAKDAQGVWTVNQGPLEADIYQYVFLVDGLRTDDPSCRCTFILAAEGVRRTDSLSRRSR